MSRLGSRGNMLVFRMLSRPKNSITTRSIPTPAPPWGRAPYLKLSMYALIPSSSMPLALAISAGQPPVRLFFLLKVIKSVADSCCTKPKNIGFRDTARAIFRDHTPKGVHVSIAMMSTNFDVPSEGSCNSVSRTNTGTL